MNAENKSSFSVRFNGPVGQVSMAETQNIDNPIVNQHINEGQNLPEAAAEIQQLLDQLEKTYPIATEADKATAVKDIQQKPQLQGRIVNALERGGKKAIEKLVDHPAAAIAIAVYEGFRESKK